MVLVLNFPVDSVATVLYASCVFNLDSRALTERCPWKIPSVTPPYCALVHSWSSESNTRYVGPLLGSKRPPHSLGGSQYIASSASRTPFLLH
jgi:hypothetical protein